jgi:hypothetical protein
LDRHPKAFKAEVIVPLQCKLVILTIHKIQESPLYPRSAMEMIRTKDDNKRNGWIRDLKKALNSIIDNEILDIKILSEEGDEPATRICTMETHKINLNSE